jgi:hypothetical protein
MRAQKINKIPMNKQINETDSPDDAQILNRDGSEETIANENNDVNINKEATEANLSDSLIYSKSPDRLVITMMKVLNTNQLKQLTENIQKIWEYDYHSKPDINIVFKLDSKLINHIDSDSIQKMVESIFKLSKMETKGWKKGYLIFKSNDPILPELVKQYEEEYRVRLEVE